MSDPQTTNLGLYIPGRGTDSGTWDQPVNANTSATDSLFGNVSVITVSNANVELTIPPNSGATWAGPYQSQSALIRLTGTITASLSVVIPRAGYFIFENLAVSGNTGLYAGGTTNAFFINVCGPTAANFCGLPPGKKCHIFCDGTNVDYVNFPDPGTAYDLSMEIAGYPTWMTGSTLLPYLIKDGGIYPINTYFRLFSVLGNTFGGTSGLNFAVPDERGRMRIGFDLNGTGRVNNVINASAMNSAGGNQVMLQSQLPPINFAVNIPAGQGVHAHGFNSTIGNLVGSGSAGGSYYSPFGSNLAINASSLPAMSGTAASGGSNAQYLPPSIVCTVPFIKT